MQKRQAKATTGLERKEFLRHAAWAVGWGLKGKLLLPEIENNHGGGQRCSKKGEGQGGFVPKTKVTGTALGDMGGRSLSSQLKSPSVGHEQEEGPGQASNLGILFPYSCCE